MGKLISKLNPQILMICSHAAGAYPASLDDAETERILSTMLELGMNTFVCLQAEVNINTPEHAWRSGHGLRPYIKDAQKILSKVSRDCRCLRLSQLTKSVSQALLPWT